MTSGFHVTYAKNADSIRQNGIITTNDQDWQQKRKDLRKKVDSYARENFDNWINRENAVFFWTCIEDALKYIERQLQYPQQSQHVVIVEVDLEGYDVGTAPYEFVEEMYRSWMNDESIQNYLEEVQNKTSPWDGSIQSNQELWCQSPIDSEDIVEIN